MTQTDLRKPAPATRTTAGGPDPVARRRLRRSLLHLVLAVVAALYLSPLLYMLVTSFKTGADAGAVDPQWIPSPATLDAYRAVLDADDSPVLQWLFNSVLAAAAHTLLVLATATPAAYALARLQFRGRSLLFTAVVATLFVPPMVLLIPNFLIVNELAWVDSLPAVIVPGAASAFGVFFMRQFFLTLPKDLEEAAEIDGCNRWQIFVRVVLPLTKPAWPPWGCSPSWPTGTTSCGRCTSCSAPRPSPCPRVWRTSRARTTSTTSCSWRGRSSPASRCCCSTWWPSAG